MGRSRLGDERQALQLRAPHLSDRAHIPGGFGAFDHARQLDPRPGESQEASARRYDSRTPSSTRHMAGWQPDQRNHRRMAGADTLRLQGRA